MSIQFVANIALPLVLILIMLALGMGLTLADFQRVAKQPRPSLIGLICQWLILPAVAFAIGHFLHLRPEFAIGLVMVSACPPAPTANLFTKIAGGDVALSISITAVATALSAVASPLLTSLALHTFSSSQADFQFPYDKLVQIFLVVTVPVVLGMLFKHWKPGLNRKLEKPVRTAALVGLMIIIVGALTKEWRTVVANLAEVGGPVVLLNIIALGFAYIFPKALKINGAQAKSISLILSMHSASIVLYIAISILGSTMIAVPIATYSLWMYATAAAFAYFIAKRA
jgi:BASS family bile acid:Na+ symporter